MQCLAINRGFMNSLHPRWAIGQKEFRKMGACSLEDGSYPVKKYKKGKCHSSLSLEVSQQSTNLSKYATRQKLPMPIYALHFCSLSAWIFLLFHHEKNLTTYNRLHWMAQLCVLRDSHSTFFALTLMACKSFNFLAKQRVLRTYEVIRTTYLSWEDTTYSVQP